MNLRVTIRFAFLALALACSSLAGAQNFLAAEAAPSISVISHAAEPLMSAPAVRPRMSPELALNAFHGRAEYQMVQLGAYSDTTTIQASLPSSKQQGQFVLRRQFEAPKTLAFKAVRFVGDNFVKTNVIARLLQQEADGVQKGVGASVAISDANYKFTYKGVDQIAGQPVYVFQLKPRAKRPGLFKGKIYLDVFTGRVRRAEGAMVKSPSFFVKKIQFVQDYADFGEFSLPVHIHSEADTRIVGKAVVDIYHADYQARSMAEIRTPGGASTLVADGGAQ